MSKEIEARRDKPQELTEALFFLTREVHELHKALSAILNNSAVLTRIDQLERKLMATQKELADDLKLVLAQQQKTVTEIQGLQTEVNTLKNTIVDLQKIIDAGGTIGQELVDAVAAVKAQAQVVDDQIPDVPVPNP